MKGTIPALLICVLLGSAFTIPTTDITKPTIRMENETISISGPEINIKNGIVNVLGPEIKMDNYTPNMTKPIITIDLNKTPEIIVSNKTRLKEKIRDWLRRHQNNTEILQRTIQKMKERILQYRYHIQKHWRARALKEYKHGLEIAKRNHGRFVQGYVRWLKAKRACETGNCTEYLNATKDMLLRAINISIERIQGINGTEELITELEHLKTLVESAENITELREIYPEIKETIRLANQVFAKQALLNLAETYLEKLNEFPEDKVADIKEQLISLSENIYTMEVKDVVHELKEIRTQIISLAKEFTTQNE